MTEDELYTRFLAGDTASNDELMIRLGDRLIVYINAYLYRTASNLAAGSHANALRTKHFSPDKVSDELSDGKNPEERVIGTERRKALHDLRRQACVKFSRSAHSL